MTYTTAQRLGLAVLGLGAMAAGTAEAAEKKIAFVACPIVRNTTLPCWMAASQGVLYYLGPQGDLGADFYPPQLGRRTLVEATVTDAPQICGGVVLKDVTASVLPIQDVSCNTILPAEGYPDPPNNRGSGPSGERGGEPPPQRPPPPPPAPPAPPFKPKTFTATFNADTSRLWRPAQAAVRDAARYAVAAKAKTVKVVGYRATMKLSDGGAFVEDADIGQERAEVVAETLGIFGVPKTTKFEVSWKTAPTPSKGVGEDQPARRVEITVLP